MERPEGRIQKVVSSNEGQVLTLERQQKENERKIAAGKMKLKLKIHSSFTF